VLAHVVEGADPLGRAAHHDHGGAGRAGSSGPWASSYRGAPHASTLANRYESKNCRSTCLGGTDRNIGG
jgi:hypothetical protein